MPARFTKECGSLTTALCLPRMWLATSLQAPLWYLEAILFLGGTVLWGFVFAWQTEYGKTPVFTLRPPLAAVLVATLGGLTLALALRLGLDARLREISPEDYPETFRQWGSTVLFSLAFTQLLLVFAPFAWLVRLFGRKEPAAFLTVLFGIIVLLVKQKSAAAPYPTGLLSFLVLSRVVGGAVAVWLYMRGGVVMVWWWGLLVQSRHLLHIHDW
jgi:hypothetical protein